MSFKNFSFTKIKHIFEFLLVVPFYLFFKLLPFKYASFVGGKILRFAGPLHPSHKTALRNLRYCFPEKTDSEIREIAMDSWENLGRVAGELPYITSISDEKLQELCPIADTEFIDEIVEASKQKNVGFMMVSAHYGNWEIGSRMLLIVDPEIALIYRKANNPYVENLIQKWRGRYTSFIIPKGDRTGIKEVVKHLKSGGRLGMLADQKMNEGLNVRMFGKYIKAPATAGDFGVKYGMPVILGRCIRDEETKTNFILKFEKPIYPDGKTAEQIVQEIYDVYERWFTEHPGQWFWQHNRFGLAD